MAPPMVAVCGKGGAGKTALSALLARAFLAAQHEPLLLIDADPALGLLYALGHEVGQTLSSVRDRIIAAAHDADDEQRQKLADDVDYLVAEALVEQPSYSLLCMGHSKKKGCFCPANKVLRQAIDLLSAPFAAVLIDAEAGVEQINRQVTQRVSHMVVVDDGSRRSSETVRQIVDMVDRECVFVVGNRLEEPPASARREGVRCLGVIPEDPLLRDFDRGGRSLWELPQESSAVRAASCVAAGLAETWSKNR